MKKDGIINTIHLRVLEGERKTVAEWAEEMEVSIQHLSAELTRCRRKGILLYSNHVVGSREAGVLVDIMANQDDFSLVNGRFDDQLVLPNIHRAFQMIEQGYKAYPLLRGQLRDRMQSIVGKADDGRRTILLTEGKG